jgi:hypothetical protein
MAIFIADFRPFYASLGAEAPHESFQCVLFCVTGRHVLFQQSTDAMLEAAEQRQCVYAWCAVDGGAQATKRLRAVPFAVSGNGDGDGDHDASLLPEASVLGTEMYHLMAVGGAALRLGVCVENWSRKRLRRVRSQILFIDAAAVRASWEAFGTVARLPVLDRIVTLCFNQHNTVTYAGTPGLTRTCCNADDAETKYTDAAAQWLSSQMCVADADVEKEEDAVIPARVLDQTLRIPGTPRGVVYDLNSARMGTVAAAAAAPQPIKTARLCGPPCSGKFAALMAVLARGGSESALAQPLLLVMPVASIPWAVRQLVAAQPALQRTPGALVVVHSVAALHAMTWQELLAARAVLVAPSLLTAPAYRRRRTALYGLFLNDPHAFVANVALYACGSFRDAHEMYVTRLLSGSANEPDMAALCEHAAHKLGAIVRSAHADDAEWLRGATSPVLDVLPFATVVVAACDLPPQCFMNAARIVELVHTHVDVAAAAAAAAAASRLHASTPTMHIGGSDHVGAAAAAASLSLFAVPWSATERACFAALAGEDEDEDDDDGDGDNSEPDPDPMTVSESEPKTADAAASHRALPSSVARGAKLLEPLVCEYITFCAPKKLRRVVLESAKLSIEAHREELEKLKARREAAVAEAVAETSAFAGAGAETEIETGDGAVAEAGPGATDAAADAVEPLGQPAFIVPFNGVTVHLYYAPMRGGDGYAGADDDVHVGEDSDDAADDDDEDDDDDDDEEQRLQNMTLQEVDARIATLRSALRVYMDAQALRRRIDASVAAVLTPSDKCVICATKVPNVILPCGHVFCFACIARWFHSHDTCPTCMVAVVVNATAVSLPEPPSPAWPAAASATLGTFWQDVQCHDMTSLMLWCLWRLADVEARNGTAAVVLPSCAAVRAFVRNVRDAQTSARKRRAVHATKRGVRAYTGQATTRTRVFAAVEAGAAHVAVSFADLCTGAGFSGVTDVIVPLPVSSPFHGGSGSVSGSASGSGYGAGSGAGSGSGSGSETESGPVPGHNQHSSSCSVAVPQVFEVCAARMRTYALNMHFAA